MSVDIGNALRVGTDIAKNSKSPIAVMSDALALYRAANDIPAGAGLGAIAAQLEKDSLLGPAVTALADLMPTLEAEMKDPVQKARLLALVESL